MDSRTRNRRRSQRWLTHSFVVPAAALLAGCNGAASNDAELSESGPPASTPAPSATTTTPAPVTTESTAPTASTGPTVPSTAAPSSTTSLEPTSDGMLATWPAAPAALPELGAAPYFLPSTEVPARAVELSTIDWSPSQVGPSHFIQEFEVAAGEMLATVDTVTDDKSAPPAGATEVTVGAWPQAYVSTDGDSTTVRLVEPPGLVDITVAGAGDTARVALAVAAALERRPTGDVGWQLAAATTKEGELVQPALPLSEGWAHGWQQRVTKWIGDDGGPLAVMIISVGQPHLTSWTMLTTPATAVDSLPTGPAVSQLIDGRGSLVAWSPQVGVTVTVMTRESVTDTVELASSLHVVSEQAWSAAGVLLPSRSEVGCDYFLNPC